VRRLPVLLLALLALPAPASASEIVLSDASTTITEGGRATVALERSPDGQPASVDVVALGASTDDVDPVSQRVSFDATQTSASFTLPLVDDDAVEPAEPLTLRLANPSPGSTIVPLDLELVVHDDDVEFGATERTVTEGGTFEVLVRRADPFAQSVVSWTIGRELYAFGGSVIPRLALPPDLQLAGGQSEAVLTATVPQDARYSGTHTGTLDLARRERRRVNPNSRLQVTIVDDDPRPAAPAIDRAGPRVQLRGSRRLRARLGWRLRLACDEPCQVRAEVRLPAATAKRFGLPRIIAKAYVNQAFTPWPTVVPTAPRPAFLRRLRRTRTLRAFVLVTASDAHRHRRVSKLPVTLTR
jgi:hypothetical protein